MQICNDLKHYCVIDLSHERMLRQDDKGDINKTAPLSLDGFRLCLTMYNLKKENSVSAFGTDFTTYEQSYINKVIYSLQLPTNIINTVTVLAKKHLDTRYKVFEIRHIK